MALTARTHDAPLLLFDVFFLLISCVQVCTLQWVVNFFRPIYHDALLLTNLFKDQLLEADTYLIANKHVLNRINSIDYGEITWVRLGDTTVDQRISILSIYRGKGKTEMFANNHQNTKVVKKRTNALQRGEQFTSNNGLRHASQTLTCIGITFRAHFAEPPFQSFLYSLEMAICH